MCKVCFLRDLRLDSPWVTLISSNNFFIEYISFSPIFFFIMDVRQNFISETVFFFVLSLVTVFDWALLCDLQNRPWKTNFIVFLVFSFQNTWLNVFSHGLVHDLWYYYFVLTFLYKVFYFTLNFLIWAFSLNFKN